MNKVFSLTRPKPVFFWALFVFTMLLQQAGNAQRPSCSSNLLDIAKEAIKDKSFKQALKILNDARWVCWDAAKNKEEVDNLLAIVNKKVNPGKRALANTGGKIKGAASDLGIVSKDIPKKYRNPKPPVLPPVLPPLQIGDMFEEGDEDEVLHTVNINDFWLAPTELTFAEYDSFCIDQNRPLPDDNGWGRGRRPVINIDWYDAIEYCNWLSLKRGLPQVYIITKQPDPYNLDPADTKKWKVSCDWKAIGYRLPTEAEWEFKARGFPSESKDSVKYYRFGNGTNEANPVEMNFDPRNADKHEYSIEGSYKRKTELVDDLQRNTAGKKGLSGNVSEWCWDWYDANYYKNPAATDNPRGPKSGSNKVCRGGAWNDEARNCRVSYRKALQPIYKGNDVGFRLAKNIVVVKQQGKKTGRRGKRKKD
jgi:formylglycine-generating enzyme required for sulfatase activity